MLAALIALGIGIGLIWLGTWLSKRSVFGGVLILLGSTIAALAAILGFLAGFD